MSWNNQPPPPNATGFSLDGAEFVPNQLGPVLHDALLQWLASRDAGLWVCVFFAGWVFCQLELFLQGLRLLQKQLENEGWYAYWDTDALPLEKATTEEEEEENAQLPGEKEREEEE